MPRIAPPWFFTKVIICLIVVGQIAYFIDIHRVAQVCYLTYSDPGTGQSFNCGPGKITTHMNTPLKGADAYLVTDKSVSIMANPGNYFVPLGRNRYIIMNPSRTVLTISSSVSYHMVVSQTILDYKLKESVETTTTTLYTESTIQ